MNPIKTTVAKVKNNVTGTLIGATAVFFGAKKFGKVTNPWMLAGLTLVGGIAGAYAQSAIAAKQSTPTAATVKK